MQRRGIVHTSVQLVFALIATVVVVVGVAPQGVAEAARQAPMAPMPQCVVDDLGNEGLGCVDAPLGAAIGGQFAAGSSFTVTSAPAGLSPCYWYTDTGCYYELYDPQLVRCVYLANGDPTDVRSCGQLSTQGAVYASRVSTVCRGELGSTFATGGSALYPDTWWVSRAARISTCHYEVADVRPIDNLLGPTFWLVRTSVDECIEPGGGYGCDESWATLERRTEYAWLPVRGTLAPHAAFVPTELGPGSYLMHNISEPYATGSTSWEWSFGDGETSTEPNPVHVYDAPGDYTVQLTMRSSEGPTSTASRVVEVRPPKLTVSVFNPDAEFGEGKSGNRYSINDTFTAKVVVSTGLGLGELTDLQPPGGLLTFPSQLQAEGTVPTVTPLTMGSNEKHEFMATVKAVSPGRFDLDSTWTANDGSGSPIDPVTGTLAGSVSGLSAEIIVEPPNFVLNEDNNDDGEITDEDNDVTIKLRVTNVAQGPITGITHEVLDLSSNVLRDPAVALEAQTSPAFPIGDLGVGEIGEIEWVYRATDAVDARAQTVVTGMINGVETKANAEGDISTVTDVLIEASITLDPQPHVSGEIVRISGTFKNVTDEGDDPRTVAFGVERQFSPGPVALPENEQRPNGGNGWFGPVGAATPAGLYMVELLPGQEIELDAIVHTIEKPERSGFKIEYSIMPFTPKEDGSGEPIVPTEYERADPRNVEISDEDGSSDTHSVTLDKVTPTLDDTEWLNCGAELGFTTYVSCKFTRGVKTFASGLWEIGVLAYQVNQAVLQGKIWMLRTYIRMITSDTEARDALIEEITADIVELKRLGYEAVQAIKVEDLIVMIPAAIDRAITRIANVLETGDLKLIAGEMAEIVGENLDMALEALVAAKVAIKATLALGGRAGLLRSAVKNAIENEGQESIEAALRVIREQGERALPGSRVMKAGVDVTDYPQIAKAYGASVDDVKNLYKIAEDQGVTIVFRSRSPKSIELIDSGKALPKPQGVKNKGVNDLDINYLGYPKEYDSIVVVAEPPVVGVPHDSDAATDAINAYLANNEKLGKVPAGPDKDDLTNALRERLRTRLKEWNEFEADRAQWERSPSDGGGVKVDFDPEFNDLGRRMIEEQPNARGRVVEEPDLADGRKVYRVQMEGGPGVPPGPDGTRFRDITGDIDFLAILTPDGRVLGETTDLLQRVGEVEKRAKIYKMMQEMLGMQHGESFTILNPEIRRKYLKDGLDAENGETLLAATPQRRLMTTYFDDGLSTLQGGPNGALIDGYQRTYFEGIIAERLSPVRTLNLLTIAQLRNTYDRLRRVGEWFGLSIFGRIVGFADDEVKPTFDRSGPALQPGEGGGVEEYVPPASQNRLTEALPGNAGGEWTAVDPASLIADGPVGLRPWTYIDGRAGPGDTEVPALPFADLGVPSGSPYLETGDVVVVDPGGADEELATLASVVPMTFEEPLTNDHEWGTMVLMAYPESISLDALVPVVPARLLESRVGPPTVDGLFAGGGRVAAGSTTEVKVTGRGGVPSDAAAVMLNVTAVLPSGPGFLTVFPCGEAVPGASNVNYGPGDVVPNAVLAKVGDGGKVCVFSLAETHLIADVNGYVPAGGDVGTVVPARLLESRVGPPTVDGLFAGGGRVAAGSTTEVKVTGRGGVPSDAAAVMLNVTAVLPSGPGFLTVFPCGEAVPGASNVNYGPGDVVPNAVLAKVGDGGKVCVFSLAETHLIADVNGYVP